MEETKNRILDITAFGAIGDGRTKNTSAIQTAIDSCEKGDTVYIPKGIFLTGALFFKGDQKLYIKEGGKLLGSADARDYPLMNYRFEGIETACYASLINTQNGEIKNFTIEGKGEINANGKALFETEMAERRGKRGRAICIRNAKNVWIKDITVRQSPAWCLHLIYCKNVKIDGVKIYTKYDENGQVYTNIFNGDGIDIDSCFDVTIQNSTISSQDDCIAIKSGKDEEGRSIGIPTEHIIVENCIFQSGFGVAVGSEMSGGVRDVLVKNCIFENTYSFASIKAPRGRGSVIEHIIYENITHINNSTEHSDCRWFRGALYMDQFYSQENFDLDQIQEKGEGTPIIRDITIKNIVINTIAGNSIFLAGLPEQPLRHIHLENIKAVGKYGMKAYYVNDLIMKNVDVISKEDDRITFYHVTGKED